MKKITITTLFLAVIICSQAQELGIQAGLNISNFKYQDGFFWWHADWENSSKRIGYNTGIFLKQKIRNNAEHGTQIFGATFETGLYLNQLGGDIKRNEEYESKISLTYLALPCIINLNYKIKKTKIQFKAGTYLSTGLWGKKTRKYISHEVTEDISWSVNSGASYMKYDFGLITGIGANYMRFGINLLYKSGLGGIWGPTSRNKAIEISLSYSVFKLNK